MARSAMSDEGDDLPLDACPRPVEVEVEISAGGASPSELPRKIFDQVCVTQMTQRGLVILGL